MKETEFILLGLLKESPKHPYQIKKEIKNFISPFTGVRIDSVYYPLKKMESKGLVEKLMQHRKKTIYRYIYKLTSKGEKEFLKSLNKSFLDFRRPRFSLNVCLYFLKHLKPSTVKLRLKGRIFLLKKLLQELKKSISNLNKEKNSYLKVIILKHDYQMVRTELKFLFELIKNFPQ